MSELTTTDANNVIEALHSIVPPGGGRIRLSLSHDRVTAIIGGDRIGFLRLGFALIRYGIEAKIGPNSHSADARELRTFFPECSHIRDLMLQLSEADSARQPVTQSRS